MPLWVECLVGKEILFDHLLAGQPARLVAEEYNCLLLDKQTTLMVAS